MRHRFKIIQSFSKDSGSNWKIAGNVEVEIQTINQSPKIFEILVTIVKELPNNSSGISNITISRLKSGVSSVTPFGNVGVARVTRTTGELLSPRSSSLAFLFGWKQREEASSDIAFRRILAVFN